MDSRLLADVQQYQFLEVEAAFLRELIKALKENNYSLLQGRFKCQLKFGTAGLRSVMGFGTNAMNTVTVRQSTQGLCEYYIRKFGLAECQRRGAIVGFDGRHYSRHFAATAAAVFQARCIPVQMAHTVTPTPLTPFAVVKSNAICGIQITASHNPKNDNGFKVYDSNGAQICAPVDRLISGCIDEMRACDWLQNSPSSTRDSTTDDDIFDSHTVTVGTNGNPGHLVSISVPEKTSQACCPFLSTFWKSYKEMVSTTFASLKDFKSHITYTAMHGVGHDFMKEILVTQLGLLETLFHSVNAQEQPHPDFPTVVFPNPEEDGVLDLALIEAEETGSSLIIANDPDADRFLVLERQGNQGFYRFSGDEIGVILARICIEDAYRRGIPKHNMLLLNSAVSSNLLLRMCETEKIYCRKTLTGFKWLMNDGFKLVEESRTSQTADKQATDEGALTLIMAYEEALGYAVRPSTVPDKDGLTAAAMWLGKCLELEKEGKNMKGYLEEIYSAYGFVACKNSYFKCADPSVAARVFHNFRELNYAVPGVRADRIRDRKVGFDTLNIETATSPDDFLTMEFTNGVSLHVRSSGTEPKLKYYCESINVESREAAEKQLNETLGVVLKMLVGSQHLEHA